MPDRLGAMNIVTALRRKYVPGCLQAPCFAHHCMLLRMVSQLQNALVTSASNITMSGTALIGGAVIACTMPSKCCNPALSAHPACGLKHAGACRCHICGLTLVSSPHLARSYHHLFPVKPFQELKSVPDTTVRPRLSVHPLRSQDCFGNRAAASQDR